MTMGRQVVLSALGAFVAAGLAVSYVGAFAQTAKEPVDPGVRGGTAGAGAPLQGLTPDENAFFRDGLVRFADIEVVTRGTNNGLGPRFNSNQCLSGTTCHSCSGKGHSTNPISSASVRHSKRRASSTAFVQQPQPAQYQPPHGDASVRQIT